MANNSAADLLQQIKNFMTHRDTDEADDLSNSDHYPDEVLDLTKLLGRINQSKTLTNEEISDISEWPFPDVSLQSSSFAFLLSAYGLVILASLLGNFLVVFVILKMRRMHTVTNVFILNVAISDILITVLNIPFNLVRVLTDEWPFGLVMCRLIPFIQILGVYSSSWMMVCIAVDRLIVTVYPLRPRMQIATGVALVVFVWLLSACLAVPYAVIHETVTTISFRTSTRCVAVYPSPAQTWRQHLSLATFIMQFCIPLSVTGVCYGKIANKLWFSRKFLSASGEHGSTQSIHSSGIVVRNRQRSIKMLVLVVAVFAVCWLPISLYHLTRDFGPEVDGSGSSPHNLLAFLLLHWLAMSSVCYNPYIYCCWNSTYRSQAKLICRYVFFCFVPKGKGETTQEVTVRGLIVRFKGSNADDLSGGRGDYRSFNWDSMVGTKEILCFHEGQRVYNACV